MVVSSDSVQLAAALARRFPLTLSGTMRQADRVAPADAPRRRNPAIASNRGERASPACRAFPLERRR